MGEKQKRKNEEELQNSQTSSRCALIEKVHVIHTFIIQDELIKFKFNYHYNRAVVVVVAMFLLSPACTLGAFFLSSGKRGRERAKSAEISLKRRRERKTLLPVRQAVTAHYLPLTVPSSRC